MTFLCPERFWIAAAIPVMFLCAWVMKRRQPVLARTVSFALRSAALLLLTWAAAEPTREIVEMIATRTVVVVDASRSVDGSARQRASESIAAWARAGCKVDVWTFGDTPTFVGSYGPGPLDEAIPWPSGAMASDLLPALGESLQAAPDSKSVSLVVVTDGAIDRLPSKLEGVAESWLVSSASERRNSIRLSSARLTSTPTEKQPFEIEVKGECTDGVQGEFGVFVDGREIGKSPVSGPAGSFAIKVPMPGLDRGRHVIGVVARTGDPETLDDHAGCVVDVTGPPRVLVIAPAGISQSASALAVQGLDVKRDDGSQIEQALEVMDHQGAVVIDRMPLTWIASEGVTSRLLAYTRRGGGLFIIPVGAKGAMAPSSVGAGPSWLPLTGIELPRPPTLPETPPKPQDPSDGLKPPEPENRTTDRRRVPTLGLLILIDASGSMKGQKLRLAKEAAIAAAEVLHEEDRIGVVAFNDRPLEVLPMTRAGDRSEVVDRISRITAAGGTDFVPALDLASEILEAENLGIKHVVLISDGESKPGRFRPRVEALRAMGATVTTIGVGYEADANTLTDIAVAGGSKYLRADNEREIPQLLVVEAERVVAASGARKREPPKPPGSTPNPVSPKPPPNKTDTPSAPVNSNPDATKKRKVGISPDGSAAYLRNVDWSKTAGVDVVHPVVARPGAWVTLVTDDGSPMFAHRHEGFGLVAMSAFAFEGDGSGDVSGFDGISAFLAQVVRYIAPTVKPERWAVGVEPFGRSFRVSVTDLENDASQVMGLAISARDAEGHEVALRTVESQGGAAVLTVPDSHPNGLMEIHVTSPTGLGKGFAAIAIPPPREVASRGGSAEGLAAIAEAIGAKVSPQFPIDPGPEAPSRRRREPVPCRWLWALLPIIMADIVVGRLWPPRRV